MAVFKNFEWDKTVRDHANNKIEFKNFNIIYGRNYSGKTTLSRIIRTLETYKISDKYPIANFNIEIENDGIISLKNLNSHTQTVRVFNEDFIKDNLRFLFNDEEGIQSFAILGDKNIEVENQINSKEIELGNEESPTGLLGEQKLRQSEFNAANRALLSKQESLNSLLTRKANNEIKQNPIYKDVNYTVRKIRDDIDKIMLSSFKDIEEKEVPNLQALLKEESKSEIPEIQIKAVDMQNIMNEVKSLIEKKITLSNPIASLLEDSLLEAWVRSGISLHKYKRKMCGFCGTVLPSNLMENLDNHFSKESEELRLEIESCIDKVEKQIKNINQLIFFDVNKFYVSEKASISLLEKKFREFVVSYQNGLQELIDQLKNRMESISKPCVFNDCNNISHNFSEIVNEYNLIIKHTNEKTKNLSNKQHEVRDKLRLHEVNSFLNTIKYSEQMSSIATLEKGKGESEKILRDIQTKVTKCKSEINDLKSKLKDEKKGAEQVNKYLNNYFGHDELTLEPINVEGESGKYRFEIRRNGKKAYHLSEGECSLVAFCYFMARLDDVNTKGNNPIIWIDDPISSLDSNHVFFVYSLINAEIVKAARFKQLFISTHNLDFLKYLKRLVNEKKVLNLLVYRKGEESSICKMPEYMVKYVTEFNYLFHKIYECANANVEDPVEATLFYDFGNNTRKFLELILAFKYPNPDKKQEEKLISFIGAGCTEALLVDRINNEYSHLFGVFERGMTLIEIPEMKKTARYILKKLQENDLEQFNALLESIGETPDLVNFKD